MLYFVSQIQYCLLLTNKRVSIYDTLLHSIRFNTNRLILLYTQLIGDFFGKGVFVNHYRYGFHPKEGFRYV